MPDNNSVKGEISVTGEWTIERLKNHYPKSPDSTTKYISLNTDATYFTAGL